MCNKYSMIVLVLSLPVLSSGQEKADQSNSKTDASEKSKTPPSALRRLFDEEVGSRLGRPRRWFISMNYEAPQEFIEKLSELKITIGAMKSDGKFLVFQNMPAKPPISFEEMDQLKFQEFAQRLQNTWYVTRSKETAKSFAEGVGLKEPPRTIFMFVPKDLESAILQYEKELYQLTEQQIREKKITTMFEIKRNGEKWQIEAIRSVIDPKLSYKEWPPK